MALCLPPLQPALRRMQTRIFNKYLRIALNPVAHCVLQVSNGGLERPFVDSLLKAKREIY
jgi:hypothetical protein